MEIRNVRTSQSLFNPRNPKNKAAVISHPAKDLKSDNINFGQGYRENKAPMHHWWEYKLVQTLFIAIWQHLVKLKVFLPYVPAILLLRIHPAEVLVHCTPRRAHGAVHCSHVCPKAQLGEKLNIHGRIEKYSIFL